ncbi:MAG: hypothetical protein UU80_C0001G0021 [candidate division WWE3 bacterium GW2011_GWA1_41_8]|uniref:FAD-binding FR-type domain-containing protein n=1 Tax=candidate division WWE3 bacterium GW2011_GWA1_41_8 TaxID=1619103 RepID=A0A0G0ZLC1_UNCKA|nr:MAG: hypothetical protein UU80_C0001G0021 [candidate division WWE3 bacterium GW2011_GWA1_41_8]
MNKKLIYTTFFANFLIIIFFWWSNSGALLTRDTSGTLLALGRLSGLLAVYFVLMQFLLMGRTRWIEKLFGLDKLSRVHHWNGKLSILLIIAHPILITLAYSSLAKTGFIEEFTGILSSFRDTLQAFIALILFSSIVFLSLYIVKRRLKYETWYFVHLLTYLAIVLAWGHQLKNGEDFLANRTFVLYWYALYTFVFGNVLIFRFIRPVYLFYKHRFRVEKVLPETHDTNSVYITGRKLDQFRVKPGQFMMFRFLQEGFWWQSHPFSLSKVMDGRSIRITPKSLGDFTIKIPELKAGTQIVIDGPYGIFTKEIATKDKFLLIAGGIGITPLRSLTEQLASEGKDIVLISCNKTEKDVVFKEELDELSNEHGFPIHYILSKDKNPNYLYGRSDKEKIQTLVPDHKERDIYICGPVAMLEGLRKDLAKLGVPEEQIHYEKFSL